MRPYFRVLLLQQIFLLSALATLLDLPVPPRQSLAQQRIFARKTANTGAASIAARAELVSLVQRCNASFAPTKCTGLRGKFDPGNKSSPFTLSLARTLNLLPPASRAPARTPARTNAQSHKRANAQTHKRANAQADTHNTHKHTNAQAHARAQLQVPDACPDV